MMNWEGFGSKRSWPDFEIQSRHLPEWTGDTRNPRQDSRSSGRDLNPGPPEYELGVVTTRPRRSVN
jgi:hypothetical protein